jgi:hypothetical protein
MMAKLYLFRRTLTVAVLGSISAGLLHGQTNSGAAADRDQAVSGGGALPAGWSARNDEGTDLSNVKFVAMAPGYHITLGPATVFYRAEDRANGPFHTLAKFHQMKKLAHPEGYGLIFGGGSLAGATQRYVYFLVRGDGKYLVKRRDGEKTSEVSKGWTTSSAVKKADAEGKATNLLEIDAKQDPSKVSFKVNGTTVHTMDAKTVGTKGLVGLRVNHNLDLHVEDFAVHQ